MQYPQIQFYKGSLVRLASGKLKQVQDLSSDDFLESARLIRSSSSHHLNNNSISSSSQQHLVIAGSSQMQQSISNDELSTNAEEIYADSSVVRDFLEVGPSPSSASPNAPSSPSSSISSQTTQPDSLGINQATTPSSSSSSCSQTRNIYQYQTNQNQNHTVLIKFFLESSRSTVFIEVPIEHPFFVFHRGWSSWNPQRTYDKFGLKCRKLKIGDTCISLIRSRKHQQQQQKLQTTQQSPPLSSPHTLNNNHHQQESEQFNMLFSSIKFDV